VAELDGQAFDDGLLVVSWGSTYGATTSAVRRAQDAGHHVSHLHLRYLSPLPRNVGEILARYDRILVPEINTGQLAFILQGRFVKSIDRLNKVQGQPFMASEILNKILEITETS
jgi:2-oxoglutarate ferredoxin oxidoreductase subunit alpha